MPFALLADGFELSLARISPAGAIALAPEAAPFRSGRPMALHLWVEGGPSLGVVADVAAVEHEPGGGKRLDLRFRASRLEDAREIAAFVEALRWQGLIDVPEERTSGRQRLSDPTQLAALWDAAARNGARAVAKRRPGLPGASLRLQRYAPEYGLLAWDAGGAGLDSPLALKLIGHSFLYELPSLAILKPRFGMAFTEIPSEVVRIRRQASWRVRPSRELSVSFRHPAWPEMAVEHPVRSVSFRGLSYWCDAARDLIYPGLELDRVEVAGPDLPAIRFSARVSSVSPIHLARESCDWQIVRLRLSPESDSDWSRWAAFVGDRLYPRTRTSRDCGRQLWGVFAESGYLNLSSKKPRHFRRSRRDFERASEKIAAHPELGARVSWLSQRGVEASVSLNKVYRQSWLGHQMARRSGATPPGATPRQMLRETFSRAFEATRADPDTRWFVGFIEGHVRWMRAATVDFSLARLASGLTDVLPFRLREGASSPGEPGVPGVAVRAAGMREARLVLEALSRQRSAAYRKAFDLTPGRLDLRVPRERWARAGMRRDRSLRVAWVRGRPAATGVFELSQPGVNLFNLLDAVRLYLLPDGEALPPGAREDALAALLADAKAWYAAAGVPRFVYYQEREQAPHSERAGLGDLGPGYVWVLSTRLLPEWMEHVYGLTSPRGAGDSKTAASDPRSRPEPPRAAPGIARGALLAAVRATSTRSGRPSPRPGRGRTKSPPPSPRPSVAPS